MKSGGFPRRYCGMRYALELLNHNHTSEMVRYEIEISTEHGAYLFRYEFEIRKIYCKSLYNDDKKNKLEWFEGVSF